MAERQSDREFEQSVEWLQRRGIALVLSMSNVLECCVPLTQSATQSNVMRLLGRLERCELRYLAEAKIHQDETISAARAFEAGGEYVSADPYVPRFDEVISPFSPPATRDYLKYGLAQTVFEIWQVAPRLFEADRRNARDLSVLRERDRARPDYLRHDLNFPRMMERTIAQFGIAVAKEAVLPLANWIWSDGARCPGLRFGYEVFHQIVRNKGEKAGETDMGDLTHVSCLPYVDVMTLDRRMRAYVAQADRALGTTYSKRVMPSFDALRRDLDADSNAR